MNGWFVKAEIREYQWPGILSITCFFFQLQAVGNKPEKAFKWQRTIKTQPAAKIITKDVDFIFILEKFSMD